MLMIVKIEQYLCGKEFDGKTHGEGSCLTLATWNLLPCPRKPVHIGICKAAAPLMGESMK